MFQHKKQKERKQRRETAINLDYIDVLSMSLYQRGNLPMATVTADPVDPPIGIHEMMRKMMEGNR